MTLKYSIINVIIMGSLGWGVGGGGGGVQQFGVKASCAAKINPCLYESTT